MIEQCCIIQNKRGELPVMYHSTQICWSPNDKLLMTGTARTHKQDGPGRLVFMNRENLDVVKEVPVGERSVVACMWHYRLNQIVYTTSDGMARVLFDEKLSHRGAKLCMAKKKRVADYTEMNVNLNVVVPFQPKNYREPNKTSTERVIIIIFI